MNYPADLPIRDDDARPPIVDAAPVLPAGAPFDAPLPIAVDVGPVALAGDPAVDGAQVDGVVLQEFVHIVHDNGTLPNTYKTTAPTPHPALQKKQFWSALLKQLDPKVHQDNLEYVYSEAVPLVFKTHEHLDSMMEFVRFSPVLSCETDAYWSTGAVCEMTLKANPLTLCYCPLELQRQFCKLVAEIIPYFRNSVLPWDEAESFFEDTAHHTALDNPMIKKRWIESGLPLPHNYVSEVADERADAEALAKYCLFPKSVWEYFVKYNDSEDDRQGTDPDLMTDDEDFMTQVVSYGRPELYQLASKKVQASIKFKDVATSTTPRSSHAFIIACQNPEYVLKSLRDVGRWRFLEEELFPELTAVGGLFQGIGDGHTTHRLFADITSFAGEPDEPERTQKRKALAILDREMAFFPSEETRSVRRRLS